MLKSKKSKQSVTLMLIDRPASQNPCLVKTEKFEEEEHEALDYIDLIHHIKPNIIM